MRDPQDGRRPTLLQRLVRSAAISLVATGLFLVARYYMGEPLDPIVGLMVFGVCFVILFAMRDGFRDRSW